MKLRYFIVPLALLSACGKPEQKTMGTFERIDPAFDRSEERRVGKEC